MTYAEARRAFSMIVDIRAIPNALMEHKALRLRCYLRRDRRRAPYNVGVHALRRSARVEKIGVRICRGLLT